MVFKLLSHKQLRPLKVDNKSQILNSSHHLLDDGAVVGAVATGSTEWMIHLL